MRNVLLIDAVIWSEASLENHPLRDVGGWFRRHLAPLPNVGLRAVSAEADLLPELDNETCGVIISGSPRDAWTDDPVNLRLCEFVHACRDRGIPMLGVCYGHQIIARALGGVVARHPGGLELGNTGVKLTPAGMASPLFKGLPRQFEVFSSHADAVLELPSDCELLVTGEFTLNQGFHWKGKLLGVQFHPEQDPELLRFLWNPQRRERWRGKVSFDLDRTFETLRPTPCGGAILRNFVEHIAL